MKKYKKHNWNISRIIILYLVFCSRRLHTAVVRDTREASRGLGDAGRDIPQAKLGDQEREVIISLITFL